MANEVKSYFPDGCMLFDAVPVHSIENQPRIC